MGYGESGKGGGEGDCAGMPEEVQEFRRVGVSVDFMVEQPLPLGGLLRKQADVLEAWGGAARAGGVWVGLAARASIDENIYVINDRDAEWLFYHSNFEGEIERIKAACPKLKHVICLDKVGLSHPYFLDFIAEFADVRNII